MLKITNKKLSTAGIEFSLPEKFYIGFEEMEVIHPDRLNLLSPEKDCYISFMTTEVEFSSPLESLMDIFFDKPFNEKNINMFEENNNTGYIWIEKPQMCKICDLNCAIAKYETKADYYYEVHFERIEGYDRQLEILLTVPKKHHINIEEILNRNNIKEFYNSIKLLATK